jgi:Leucine-rich repeat (LRR) protein
VISKIATLRDLKIANNGLSGELDSGLSNLCNLEVLDIQKNQLNSLPGGLVDLVRLRILNLSGNAFKSLPFETLRHLPLTELSAANNKLSGVLISFEDVELAVLKELDITGNSLTSLSSGTLSLPALHTLSCSANRLTSLPDITTWTSLLTITAEDNSISDIPDGFISLTKLKSADFNGNNIKLIPDQLALMDSLDYFRISGNPLREKKFSGMNTADLKRALLARIQPATPERVPEFDTNVDESESEYLDAPSSLPRSPTSWPVSAMGILDRSNTNSFTLNPVTAAQVASSNMVKTVELHHNAFTEIPASIAFFGLTLTSLSLSHNELTSDTFLKDELDLPVLRELNLSSNTFNSLQPLIRYLNAPQLTKLDISFNRLTSLPTLRPAFPNLVVVLASNNTVRELYPDAVRGLKILDLQDNEINGLNAKLGLITGLERLEVKGNRFRVPKWTVLEKGTEYLLGWLRDKIPVGELDGEGLGQGSVQDIGETF